VTITFSPRRYWDSASQVVSQLAFFTCASAPNLFHPVPDPHTTTL